MEPQFVSQLVLPQPSSLIKHMPSNLSAESESPTAQSPCKAASPNRSSVPTPTETSAQPRPVRLRSTAQTYADFTRLPTLIQKGKKSKRELQMEKERVQKERQRNSDTRFEALEELNARRILAHARMKLCHERCEAAKSKNERNRAVLLQTIAHYDEEMAAHERHLEEVQKECEDSEQLLEERGKEMEMGAQLHAERISKFEEWCNAKKEEMQDRQREVIQQKVAQFDANRQLVEVESDVKFLEEVLKDLKHRSNVVQQLQEALKQAINAKPRRK